MPPKKWLVVGISGPPCGGKYNLSREITDAFENVVTLSQRRYEIYKDKQEDGNWLSFINMKTFVSDAKLVTKNYIHIPGATVKNCVGNSTFSILVITGFHIMDHYEMKDLLDLKYHIDLQREQFHNKINTQRGGVLYGWEKYEQLSEKLRKDKSITKLDGTWSPDSMSRKIIDDITYFDMDIHNILKYP